MKNSNQNLLKKTINLNLGPNHPATHGVFRFILELDGETILNSETETGYLHRGFEKEAERKTYTQIIPYTDRLNYVSAINNNVGYVTAVEKMLNIEIPERAKWIRVIICEIMRIMDHFICVGINGVDVGAFTNFIYFFEKRERLNELLTDLCGARLTTNYTRIGGVSQDLPENWLDKLKEIIKIVPEALKDVDKLLTRNGIFMDRTIDVGKISKEDAISYAYTGPCLRACGVDYDLRKANPYLVYDELDFDIPVDDNGDIYSRYIVRMEEMWQSLRIIEQCIDKIPDGPVNIDNPSVTLPEKEDVYNKMESMIRQFKIITDGIRPPAGTIYSATESPNGELGFYIVSDGGISPYRVRVRPPCLPIFSSMDSICKGHMIADLVTVLGSLNIIAGELER